MPWPVRYQKPPMDGERPSSTLPDELRAGMAMVMRSLILGSYDPAKQCQIPRELWAICMMYDERGRRGWFHTGTISRV